MFDQSVDESQNPGHDNALRDAARISGLRSGVRILAEPGRAIVAQAAVTLYRVGVVKPVTQRTYMAVDGGMSDNPRPVLYGSGYEAFLPRSVGATRPEAIRLAGPYLEEKYKAYRAWGQDKVMPAGDHFDHGFDELLEDRFLFGSPAEVAEQMDRLNRRLGVNHIVASVHWVGMPNRLALEQLQILAEEVMPLLRL